MSKFRLPLALAFAAVAGLAVRYKRQGSGPIEPRYPDFSPDDFPPELFEAQTEDGLTLRGKRYANEGARPVLLLAGFSGNGFNYDIAFEESNFALHLARKGYDVWVCNFRGTGREPYKSDGGDYSHYIQDLCIYDLPALIGRVAGETMTRPVMMGHSMGGVVCYGYLQGVQYEGEDHGRRLRPDPALAKQRNESIAAVVSLAGPASFYWPMKSRYYYWLVASPLARLFLRLFRALLVRLDKRARQAPIEDSVVGLVSRTPNLAYDILRIGYSLFANLKNMNREMVMESAISGMSDVSVREQFQLVNALLTRDLIGSSALKGDSPDERHNFTKSMHLISAPIFFVAVELDAVHPDVLYRDGFEQVSSATKDYVCFEGYGHVDLIQGLDIGTTVLPRVTEWLERVL